MAKKKKIDEEVEDEPKKDKETSDGTVAVNDAWTGMLAVSLLALVVGSGLLIYDWSLYNFSDVQPPTPTKVTGLPPGAPPKVVAPPPPPPKVEPAKDAPMEKKDAEVKDMPMPKKDA
jgi:hypothetical protein